MQTEGKMRKYMTGVELCDEDQETCSSSSWQVFIPGSRPWGDSAVHSVSEFIQILLFLNYLTPWSLRQFEWFSVIFIQNHLGQGKAKAQRLGLIVNMWLSRIVFIVMSPCHGTESFIHTSLPSFLLSHLIFLIFLSHPLFHIISST